MFVPPLIVALAATFGTVSVGHAEILIGLAAPLTGPNAWLAEQTERGVALAVADLNAAGGVLGQQVEVVTADDYCDGEQAVAAANKLVAVGVVFVAGNPCSGAAIPASEVHAAAGILMISNAATNPVLTERGLDNVFRVVGRDDQQGTIAATIWRTAGATSRSQSYTTARPTGGAWPRKPGSSSTPVASRRCCSPKSRHTMRTTAPWSPSCPPWAPTWCTTAAMHRKPG